MGRLGGKVAVITGAASGIGTAMVVDGGFTAGGSLIAPPGPLPGEFAGPSFERKA